MNDNPTPSVPKPYRLLTELAERAAALKPYEQGEALARLFEAELTYFAPDNVETPLFIGWFAGRLNLVGLDVVELHEACMWAFQDVIMHYEKLALEARLNDWNWPDRKAPRPVRPETRQDAHQAGGSITESDG